MRAWMLAGLLGAASLGSLGCRGEGTTSERAGEDERLGAGASTDSSSDSGGATRGQAGRPSEDDPFAGIEALRPKPWTGWPLENVDLRTEAGWRIDPISGGFELEQGLRMAADAGAFVLAIAPGRVLAVRRAEARDGDREAAGLELVIDHGDGIESHYAPLSDALVHPGLPVARGAAIGLARGDRLRLLVTVDGVAIDPLLALRQPLHRWPALLRSLPPPSEPGPTLP